MGSHESTAAIMRARQFRRLLSDPAKAAVAAGWVGRIIAALAQFAAIRILTQMLGVNGYGAYAVVTGLLAWFLLADIGLGSSLQNHISARRVIGERADDAIWSISLFLTATTGLLAAALAVVSPWAGSFLLGAFRVPTLDAQFAFFAFGVIACATAAANIVLKVFFAHHRGYLSHAITTGAALLGVLMLVLIGQLDVPHRLVWAIVGFYLPGWLLPATAITYYLSQNRPHSTLPRFGIDLRIVRGFWSSARWFVSTLR